MNDSKDHKAAAEPPLDCRVRGWQPIETAPKDVVFVVSDGEVVAVGWWNGPALAHWMPAGKEPTYWMHLPEAPNA